MERRRRADVSQDQGRFYEEVARDEVLRPLYPEEDLAPAEERMRPFLMRFGGGPTA